MANLFAISDQQPETLLIDSRATGIPQLCMLTDGMKLKIFGSETIAYLDVDDVIEWHRKELAETKGRSGNQELLDKLTEIRERFLSGDVQFHDSPVKAD